MRIIKIFFLLLASLIIWLAVRQYLFCPAYSFTDNKPFSGDKWYNPYANTDSGTWIKCNFHAHVKAWGGISNGHGTVADVWKGYDSLGYTIHCVSDYHKINDDFKDNPEYISAYEHGYNIKKTHQLILGGDKVHWLDYILPQTLSNKQDILNKLSKEDDNVIIINHPGMRNGYTADDMKYLVNYDCIEILNPQAISLTQWDAALSSGMPVFAVGDDDMHNVFHPLEMGRYCTWLNVTSVNRQNVLAALKEGKGYAMSIGQIQNEDHFARQRRISSGLPVLKNFFLSGDTLSIEMSKDTREMKFIGQNGKILATVNNTATASYVLKPGDTYVRISAQFGDGTEIFLNPVFRYSSSPLTIRAGAEINIGKTIFLFILAVVILTAWGVFFIRNLFAGYYKKKKEKNKLPAYPIE
jgi:hypothetical protein